MFGLIFKTIRIIVSLPDLYDAFVAEFKLRLKRFVLKVIASMAAIDVVTSYFHITTTQLMAYIVLAEFGLIVLFTLCALWRYNDIHFGRERFYYGAFSLTNRLRYYVHSPSWYHRLLQRLVIKGGSGPGWPPTH